MPFQVLVSSAKEKSIELVIPLLMSDMSMRKRSGPNTEPCGTPHSAVCF